MQFKEIAKAATIKEVLTIEPFLIRRTFYRPIISGFIWEVEDSIDHNYSEIKIKVPSIPSFPTDFALKFAFDLSNALFLVLYRCEYLLMPHLSWRRFWNSRPILTRQWSLEYLRSVMSSHSRSALDVIWKSRDWYCGEISSYKCKL